MTDTSKTVIAGRCIAFVLLITFMFGGPFYGQALGKKSMVFRTWKMFGRSGLDLFEVRFTLRTPVGEIPIDRFEVLGVPKGRHAPERIWRIERTKHLRRLCREMCKELGDGADLRLYARRATTVGWETIHAGEENICQD